jgi:HD-like signal output (HDOD) protein
LKRVLFVDDEPKVLEGLQRMLRPQRHEWQMSFAEGPTAALEVLAREPFDVVVTDMRMPEMDGAALLEKVRELYPRTGRIVLSGYTEVGFAYRTVRVAHQFLLKPCDAESLRQAVARTCNLQDLLSSESLASVVGEIGELPSAPRLYMSLTQALANPKCSIERIAEIIEQDVGISAKVLQLVNSAFFGLSRDVKSIRQAVNYLGMIILQNLVASVEAFRAFQGSPRLKAFSIEEFESHAQLTARITRTFTMPKIQGEAAMAAAVLHDVGKLVLASRLPEHLEQAIRLSHEKKQPMHEIEAELYAVTHAEIGAYLLGLWGLPMSITEAVAYHHVPLNISHEKLSPVAVVYLSNILAHEIEGKDLKPTPDEATLRQLGVTEPYSALQERAQLACAARGAANA